MLSQFGLVHLLVGGAHDVNRLAVAVGALRHHNIPVFDFAAFDSFGHDDDFALGYVGLVVDADHAEHALLLVLTHRPEVYAGILDVGQSHLGKPDSQIPHDS